MGLWTDVPFDFCRDCLSILIFLTWLKSHQSVTILGKVIITDCLLYYYVNHEYSITALRASLFNNSYLISTNLFITEHYPVPIFLLLNQLKYNCSQLIIMIAPLASNLQIVTVCLRLDGWRSI